MGTFWGGFVVISAPIFNKQIMNKIDNLISLIKPVSEYPEVFEILQDEPLMNYKKLLKKLEGYGGQDYDKDKLDKAIKIGSDKGIIIDLNGEYYLDDEKWEYIVDNIITINKHF